MDIIIWLIFAAVIVIGVAVFVILKRGKQSFDFEILRGALSEEFRNNREESAVAAKMLREEIADSQKKALDSVGVSFKQFSDSLEKRFERVKSDLAQLSEATELRLERFRTSMETTLRQNQESS